jgi:hypothetical protein
VTSELRMWFFKVCRDHPTRVMIFGILFFTVLNFVTLLGLIAGWWGKVGG